MWHICEWGWWGQGAVILNTGVDNTPATPLPRQEPDTGAQHEWMGFYSFIALKTTTKSFKSEAVIIPLLLHAFQSEYFLWFVFLADSYNKIQQVVLLLLNSEQDINITRSLHLKQPLQIKLEFHPLAFKYSIEFQVYSLHHKGFQYIWVKSDRIKSVLAWCQI